MKIRKAVILVKLDDGGVYEVSLEEAKMDAVMDTVATLSSGVIKIKAEPFKSIDIKS